jgi:hypothetical protein
MSQGMLAALKADLDRDAPPTNMGSYNDFPEDVSFWREPPARRRPRVSEGWCGLGGHTTAVGRMLRQVQKININKKAKAAPAKSPTMQEAISQADSAVGVEEETYHRGSGAAFLEWYSDQLVASVSQKCQKRPIAVP